MRLMEEGSLILRCKGIGALVWRLLCIFTISFLWATTFVCIESEKTLNTSFSLKERYYCHLNRPGSMHGTNISHSQRGIVPINGNSWNSLHCLKRHLECIAPGEVGVNDYLCVSPRGYRCLYISLMLPPQASGLFYSQNYTLSSSPNHLPP